MMKRLLLWLCAVLSTPPIPSAWDRHDPETLARMLRVGGFRS